MLIPQCGGGMNGDQPQPLNQPHYQPGMNPPNPLNMTHVPQVPQNSSVTEPNPNNNTGEYENGGMGMDVAWIIGIVMILVNLLFQ